MRVMVVEESGEEIGNSRRWSGREKVEEWENSTIMDVVRERDAFGRLKVMSTEVSEVTETAMSVGGLGRAVERRN